MPPVETLDEETKIELKSVKIIDHTLMDTVNSQGS